MERATILRAGAALLTAAAFAASGEYVVAHPKNDAAPLKPPAASPVALSRPAASPTPGPTAAGRATPTPRITTAPGVKATALPKITYTHVS